MSKSARNRAREAYKAGLRHLTPGQRKFAKTAFNALRREGHSLEKAVEHALTGASVLRHGESPMHALRRLVARAGSAVEQRGHKAIDSFVSSTGKKLLDKGMAKTEAFLGDQINKSKGPRFVKNIAKNFLSAGAKRAKERITAEGSKRAKSVLSKVVSKIFGGGSGGGRKRGGHPYSRGPIGRAEGFYSIDRRTGKSVPRRLTMHRQNIHTV